MLAMPARAAVLFDPALRFRVLPTEHFVIYFHQGEDLLAQRLAVIAEETWQALRQPLGAAPPPRTHVVLADQAELSNGYATPLPYDTVVVTAAWPAGSEFIGDTDDWLRVVFTHEFTHIVHLDRSEGWARAVRRIFGRVLVALPNVLLPTWQIEGLATYEESVITGGGRLHAGDFGAIVGEEARLGARQPLDRVNGGLTDWPNGLAAYAYGLGFHQYLADRFGAGTLARLADATARRVPYTASRAFRHIYGESLGDLWRDYQRSLAAAAPPPPVAAGLARLTHHGFAVTGPRFDPFACDACPPQIVYSVRTPHGFPALNRVGVDGTGATRLTTRYLGTTTAVDRDAVYFDQQELRRNVGVYSDLYAWSRADNRVTQLTSEARLLDPDLSPERRTLVCVQDRSGQRDLVLVRLKPDTTYASVVSAFRRTVDIETLVSEPETQFNAPRWSPDGRTIAVERHRLGAGSEIVLVDVETKAVRVLASDARARIVTPAWHPDGRAVVAAMAPRDAPFNLHEFTIDRPISSRQLTHMTGGATWPDVSADGRTIVFVGYTVEGFDLFTMPYPVGDAAERRQRSRQSADVSAVAQSAKVEGAKADRQRDVEFAFTTTEGPTIGETYSPLPTLKPTSWSPVVERDNDQVRLGAAVSGYDVLGYHFYAASATWRVSSPAGAEGLAAGTPDWQAYYAYGRWRPTFWTAAQRSTSFFAGPAADNGQPSPGLLRERELEGGVVLPIRHTRTSHAGSLSLIRAADDYTLPDRAGSRHRTAARAAWGTTSAHIYGYSVSPEGGVSAGTTAEIVRRQFGSFADATTMTADVRAYGPGVLAHHVLAVRAAAGVSTGDRDMRRTFHLGGAGPDASVVNFGRGAISLLRGFAADSFAGSHVALVNADYRFPIARPQRGAGTWPLFVHTIHGAVFGDAGHAWTRAFRASAVKTSIGAELSAHIVAGYVFPFTFTAGSAWGHDGSRTLQDRATVYFRVGRAF